MMLSSHFGLLPFSLSFKVPMNINSSNQTLLPYLVSSQSQFKQLCFKTYFYMSHFLFDCKLLEGRPFLPLILLRTLEVHYTFYTYWWYWFHMVSNIKSYLHKHKYKIWSFVVAQMVKNPPAMRETWIQAPGWKDTPEEDMATHTSILAWNAVKACLCCPL